MHRLSRWINFLLFCCLANANTAADTSMITDEQIDGALKSVIHRLLADNDDDQYVEEVLSKFIKLILKTIRIPELSERFLQRIRALIDEEINIGQCGAVGFHFDGAAFSGSEIKGTNHSEGCP